MEAVVVGLGSAGQCHLGNLRMVEVDIVALADPTFTPTEIEGVVYYRDPDLCLEDHAKGRVVIIASPSKFHYEQVMKAVDCDCAAVLVEKPMALNSEQSGEMADAVDVMGIPAAVGHNFRFHGGCNYVKSQTQGVSVFTSCAVDNITEWPNYGPECYMLDTEQGGVLLTSSSHAVDLALWLNGDAEKVSAMLAYQDELATKVMIRIDHTSGSPSALFNEWSETRSYSVLSLVTQDHTCVLDFYSSETKKDGKLTHLRMMKAFTLYAGGGEAGELCTFHQGHKVMEILDATLVSWKEKRIVNV